MRAECPFLHQLSQRCTAFGPRYGGSPHVPAQHLHRRDDGASGSRWFKNRTIAGYLTIGGHQEGGGRSAGAQVTPTIELLLPTAVSSAL